MQETCTDNSQHTAKKISCHFCCMLRITHKHFFHLTTFKELEISKYLYLNQILNKINSTLLWPELPLDLPLPELWSAPEPA